MQVAPIWDQTQEDLEKIGIFWLLRRFIGITWTVQVESSLCRHTFE